MRADTGASVWLRAPSFRMRLARWTSTVFTLMSSRPAFEWARH